ncbi:unnamed protein product [Cuscuta epithymum]|uniref:Uncharacterized protein n=1 Tax=Cuscuta epithymum TaxID=186058 RepID=A0AAV0FIS6_9ASTE|nr:unnamed protein product [Cuscuta epithymum]
MATNVLGSAIGPSAPSHLASRFGPPIPFRMATTVLCSTIGPSAPSYPAHVQLVHPFQDGDERLMHHDRPLSAIVSHGSARPFPPGWRRPSYAARSASQRHRVSFTFGSPHSLQDGDERLMQCDRPLSAIALGFTVRPAHSLQDGDDRLMQHDRLLGAIVSLSRSDRPFPPGWRRPSYAVRSAPQRHRTWLHGSARPFPSGWRRTSYAARSAPQRHRVWLTLGSPIPFRMATNVSYAARSAPQRHRVWLTLGSPIPFKMATNVSLCSTISAPAPSCLAHVRVAHPFQDGGETSLMQHDQRPSAIVSGSR